MAERQIVREGPLAEFIPNGVKAGNLITLSGQVALDDKGAIVGKGDIVAQARQAYAHVESSLEQFGASMADIVDETYFVTDVRAAMANVEEFWKARSEAYGGEPQVSQTMVQVAALVMPDLMIEIKVMAVVS